MSVPDREDVLVFARMLNCTCALPLPLAALVNEIQATFEAAVHVHVAVDVVTVTDPVVADAPIETLAADNVTVQGGTTGVGGGGAAAWAISTR